MTQPDEAPQRVRVTGPPRRRTPPPARAAATDVGQGTRLGEVYLGSLLRAQLGLAARILSVLVVGVAGWPLLFHLAPGLAEHVVLGLPVAWWLLGVVVYPLLALLGLRFVRRAEENEARFADLLSHRRATDAGTSDPERR